MSVLTEGSVSVPLRLGLSTSTGESLSGNCLGRRYKIRHMTGDWLPCGLIA